MQKVKDRQATIVRDSREGLEAWVRDLPNCTVYRGHARLESPSRVRVGDDSLEARQIFINVGGRASVPSIGGLDRVTFLTNSSMMDVEFVPGHLVVIGGSYIGLEFAQIYRRFGGEVTVMEMAPRLVAREDADVSDAIRDILRPKASETDLTRSVIRSKVATRVSRQS